MKILKSLTLIILAVFLFSCGETTNDQTIKKPTFEEEFGDKTDQEQEDTNNKGINYKKLATQICDCSQKSIGHNVKMEQIQKEGNSKEFLKMLNVAPKYFNEALKCAKEAKSIMSPVPIDGQKFNSNLSRQCNSMPKRMREQLFHKINKTTPK